MKTLLIIIILCLAGRIFSYGQCALALCKNTGAWGASYNSGNDHLTDQEYKDRAIKACRDNGGTGCTLIGLDNTAGWWAMLSGNDGNGTLKVGFVEGKSSQGEAEVAAIRDYENSGGVNAINFKVTSWRVYARN